VPQWLLLLLLLCQWLLHLLLWESAAVGVVGVVPVNCCNAVAVVAVAYCCRCCGGRCCQFSSNQPRLVRVTRDTFDEMHVHQNGLRTSTSYLVTTNRPACIDTGHLLTTRVDPTGRQRQTSRPCTHTIRMCHAYTTRPCAAQQAVQKQGAARAPSRGVTVSQYDTVSPTLTSSWVVQTSHLGHNNRSNVLFERCKLNAVFPS